MNNKLYKDTVKLIKETNRRLSRLEKGVDLNKGRYNPKTKRFERKGDIILVKDGKRVRLKVTKRARYPVGTWATKKLESRLSDIDINIRSNKIKISENINSNKLIKLNKALRLFLNSQTSTVSGIQEVEKQTKQNIRNILSDFDEDTGDIFEPSNKDIEKMYDLFGTDDMNTITDYIPPSDFFVILNQAKEENDSNVKFLNRIRSILDDETVNKDDDLAEALVRTFNKFKS